VLARETDAVVPPTEATAQLVGRCALRRIFLVLSVVVLLGSLAVWNLGVRAQESIATPGPGEVQLAPGQIGRELPWLLYANEGFTEEVGHLLQGAVSGGNSGCEREEAMGGVEVARHLHGHTGLV
jgi:hypothetical protein